MLSAAKATKLAKVARTAAPKAPAKPKATKGRHQHGRCACAQAARRNTQGHSARASRTRRWRHFGRDYGRNCVAKTLSPRLHLHTWQQARLHGRQHPPEDGPGALLLDYEITRPVEREKSPAPAPGSFFVWTPARARVMNDGARTMNLGWSNERRCLAPLSHPCSNSLQVQAAYRTALSNLRPPPALSCALESDSNLQSFG
jgi:hypothetical protein